MYDQESDNLFKQLETISVDPYIVRSMIQGAELEGILNDTTISDSEYDQMTKKDIEKEIIEKMDTECPHIGMSVLVTGTLLEAYYDEIEEKYCTMPVDVDKKLVTSMGYSTLLVNVGEPEEKIVVGNIFLLESGAPFRQDVGLVDYVPRLYGFAPLGSVDIEFDEPDIDNIQLLQHKVPELVAQIDDLISNEDNECDALKNLRNMTLTQEMDIPHETLSALILYTYTRLDFDTAVPYELVIQGMFYGVDKLNNNSVSNQYLGETAGLIIAYPTALAFMPYPSMKDKNPNYSDEAHWHVDLRTMAPTANGREVRLIVPVRNIRQMHSIRRIINEQ